jgi:hypothetical protein
MAAAGMLLASCTRLLFSNVTVAYNNATPVIVWWVDDYVDLSDAQKSWMRERLSRTLAWHRARELPEYRRFFERVSAQVADNISVEEARAAQRELRAGYHRLLDHMLPDMAELLVQLDAEQLVQIERKFAADNRKIVKDSLEGTPEERNAKRVKRYIEQLQGWTGRLNRAQRDLVAAQVKTFPEFLEERLGERRFRQGAFMEIARAKPPREEAIAALRLLLVETDSWRRPEYQQKLRERDEQLFGMFASLSATLSADQRANLQARLRGFMRDITELTASN